MPFRKRLVALDFLRGLALLGIMANHVFYLSAHPIAAAMQDYHAVAFFLISGIVFTYVGKKRALPNVVRGIICIVFGVVLMLGNPPVDVILVNYGIMFLIAAFTVPRMSTRVLGMLGLVLLVLSPIASQALRGELGEANHGVLGALLHPVLYGHYPLLQWSAVFFIGAWIGRLVANNQKATTQLSNGIASLALILIGALGFSVSKGISDAVEPGSTPLFMMGDGNVGMGWSDLFQSYAYSGTTLGLTASMSVVFVAWGMIMSVEPLLCHAKWVIALGQATLSIYVIHVFIMLLVGIPDSVWSSVLYYSAQVVGCVVLINLWHKYKLPSRGPLEAITQFIVNMEDSKPAKQSAST